MKEMLSTSELRLEAEALGERMRSLYRIMHQNPELGRQEWETAALVERSLAAMGVETTRVAETGVVGLLRGDGGGRTIALRSELDALPIGEESGLPWSSRRTGVMHACGHDFHAAALLGAAHILSAHRGAFCGNVKFFFQPDEEGEGGAERMIRAGCMEHPEVDAVFAIHCDSGRPVGQAEAVAGRISAASNPFRITLHGRGSHGAKPHEGDDVIVAGAQILQAIQTLVSRRTPPTEPVVITVGTFHSGTAGNVLPTKARLTGIIRTLGGEMRQRVTEQFRTLTERTAHAMGVHAEVELEESYPGVVNDPCLTRLVQQSAAALLGQAQVITDAPPSMGTDDFGYFSGAAAGCYCRLGTSDPSWQVRYPNHTPRFRISEDALPLAAALHARVALDFLGDGTE